MPLKIEQEARDNQAGREKAASQSRKIGLRLEKSFRWARHPFQGKRTCQGWAQHSRFFEKSRRTAVTGFGIAFFSPPTLAKGKVGIPAVPAIRVFS